LAANGGNVPTDLMQQQGCVADGPGTLEAASSGLYFKKKGCEPEHA
jgi:hypothetical protein